MIPDWTPILQQLGCFSTQLHQHRMDLPFCQKRHEFFYLKLLSRGSPLFSVQRFRTWSLLSFSAYDVEVL